MSWQEALREEEILVCEPERPVSTELLLSKYRQLATTPDFPTTAILIATATATRASTAAQMQI
jgi:hypothetical protein